jgi:hypothetical protein
MIKVVKATLVGNYSVCVEFNSGENGIIDFKDILSGDHRPIICELLDDKLFKTMKVALNTLCWDNGVDFAPDFLHDQVKVDERKVALRALGHGTPCPYVKNEKVDAVALAVTPR